LSQQGKLNRFKLDWLKAKLLNVVLTPFERLGDEKGFGAVPWCS